MRALKRVARLSLGVAFLFSSVAFAQKAPVAVDATIGRDDQVGQQFVFELKEGIRSSQAFRLIDEDGQVFPRITVAVVTVASSQLDSAISLSFLYDDANLPMRGLFIFGSVRNCGRDVVETCARGTLASIDQAVSSLGKQQPALKHALYRR